MSTLDNFSVVINITTVSDPQKIKKRNEKNGQTIFLFTANGIQNLTTDYRFGLGTSMDKAVRPFSRISAEL